MLAARAITPTTFPNADPTHHCDGQGNSQHILFEPGWWQSSALLQLDLILQGVASWRAVFGLLWSILVRNEQPVLDFGLLPPDADSASTHAHAA